MADPTPLKQQHISRQGVISEGDPFIVTSDTHHEANGAIAASQEEDQLQGLLPAPLSHQTFSSVEFDVNTFLLSRRHTSLDELRSELRAYLGNLRQELVGVINRDYEDFIGLGVGLRGTHGKLERMRLPVEAVKQAVEHIKEDLVKIRTEVQDKLDQRTRVREQEGTLRLLLSIHDSVLKVEVLLLISSPEHKDAEGVAGTKDKSYLDGFSVSGSAMKRSSSQSSSSQTIERVASEYNQMFYLVHKAGDVPFVKSLQPRLEYITTTLHRDLASLLTSLLDPAQQQKKRTSLIRSQTSESQQQNSLLECLRAYLTLGKIKDAEQVMRKEFVRPWVNQNITREALLSPQSPRLPATPATAAETTLASALTPTTDSNTNNSSNPPPAAFQVDPIQSTTGLSASGLDPLVELYNKTLSFITRDCAFLLDIAERRLAPSTTAAKADKTDYKDAPDGDERGFHVLANVIWAEVADGLVRELGQHIFASGRTDAFHANYTASQAFISRLEHLCPTLTHLQHLRNHEAYQAFNKKWQLQVYFQLRLKEIVGRLEETLASRDACNPRYEKQDVQFLLSGSEAAHRAIWTCWQPSVLLQDLLPRFWRLTLQVISRYKTWLGDTTAPLLAASRAAEAAATSTDKDKSTAAASNVPSRTSTPQPNAGQAEVSDERALRQLSAHVADLGRLTAALSEFFDQKIQGALPDFSIAALEDPSQTPKALFESALESVQSNKPALIKSIISLLVKASADPLRSVKPVASQIRASSRKTGTEASYFVASILKPLRDFTTEPGKVLRDEDRQSCVAAVVAEVASRYTFVLHEMRKIDESLRKLKKGRQGGFSLFGNKSAASQQQQAEEANAEGDRVRTQMRKDVEAFLGDASSLGMDIERSQELGELQQAVALSPTQT